MSLRTKGDRYGKKKKNMQNIPLRTKWQNSFKHEKSLWQKFLHGKKKSQSKRLFSINKNKVCNKIPVSNIGKVISFISRGDKV